MKPPTKTLRKEVKIHQLGIDLMWMMLNTQKVMSTMIPQINLLPMKSIPTRITSTLRAEKKTVEAKKINIKVALKTLILIFQA